MQGLYEDVDNTAEKKSQIQNLAGNINNEQHRWETSDDPFHAIG